MTEAEITDIFGPRCAVFNARCGSCLMWRAHDEYAALVAAARKVVCARCRGTGALPDFAGETWSKTSSCPDCADLRALLAEVVRAGRTARETDGGDGA